MWSTNKKDICLRSALLAINCVACVVIIYISLTFEGKEENTSRISPENFNHPEKLTDEKCPSVCQTRGCIWHANMFLRFVNPTADPCENFRSFLCSGFQDKFGPDEKANMISETKKPMISRLKGILDNIQADPETSAGKMKTVYDSCVNYDSAELQGITDVKAFLNNMGILNWPNLPQDFSFGDTSLPIILGHFVAFGAKDFVFLRRVKGNDTEEDRLRVSFSQYLFNRSSDVPRELAVNMLKYFDLEVKDVDTIIEDHKRVKSAILNLTEEHETCYNETCPEAQIDCSEESDNDWHDFCETIGFFINLVDTDDPISAEIVTIVKPEDIFFKSLFPLLHSVSHRSLANFLALSFIKGYQAELNFYFRLSKLKHKDFDHEADIGSYELDRWKYCVRWIADNMKLSLENEFFHHYLTTSITEEIKGIFHDYSSEIASMITFQDWIPSESKTKLLDILQNITFNVDLISDIFPNDTYVNKFYEKLHPTRESFFNNVLRLKMLGMGVKSPFNPFNIEEYAPHITDFDVQASAGGPYLEIHFGMLMPPFYIPGEMNLINRVLLAPIIGHEFGHFIFDTLAYQLKTDEIFLKKRRCIGDQFSRFRFENLNENLNGSRYDMENYPDNVGTQLIDKVIEQFSTSQNIILPGLSYSSKQLLYMSGSQMWCSKSNLEKDLHHKNVDYHAPAEFRLLGTAQNSRGFPEAFHCPDGSFMNPATKCSLLDRSEEELKK